MKDRDFFLNGTPDHIPDIFGARAYNRDRLLEQLRERHLQLMLDDPKRPRLEQTEHYDRDARPLRRWVWTVENVTTGEVLASGRMPTKRLAVWRKHRAYCRVLAAVHAEREQEATP
jgi:hypothetical protein